ncbi:hypothetical protein [Pseudoxanthomonas japonensis]|uniref:hypothetical protein n=1 Tax=Pseudoxanthomonas japonensis TaxID=69284 RepID=UPI00286CA99C|nr:hypothetical protein [Pseudoxanthomonas japonensis]
MTTTTGTKRSVGYWIIAVFALVWNLIGVAMWYIQMNMSSEQLALMTEPQQQVYTKGRRAGSTWRSRWRCSPACWAGWDCC